MSEVDEFIDQPSNDAFCAAIEFWRNAFSQRRDLRNTHRFSNSARASIVLDPPSGPLELRSRTNNLP
jgi:hypothetical protein